MRGCFANDVMIGATGWLTAGQADKNHATSQRVTQHQQLFKTRNQKYLIRLLLTFLTISTFVHHAQAEKYVGCLLNEDVCDDSETCFDDYAFGRCISGSEEAFFRFPPFSEEEEALLEDEMSRLYDHGFVWTDDYTQCIMQTTLAAIRDQTEYDTQLCDMTLAQEQPELVNDVNIETPLVNDIDNYIDDTLPPSLSQEEIFDPIRQVEPEQLYLTLRDAEEPIELQGIDFLPLERSKFYQEPSEDLDEQDTIMLEPMLDDEDTTRQVQMGQVETLNSDFDNLQDFDYDDRIFDRRGRIDVKKPGPFFESSPNNFYLDKLTYRYDTEDTDPAEDTENNAERRQDKQQNKTQEPVADVENEDGQQEYEIPMSTSGGKAKRLVLDIEEHPGELDDDNYVHILLNNKFQHWGDGSDFINALAWELGLPEHALSDRTIEKQHVQFKVEPNEQNVDASKVANALSDDINIQKRLTNTLGVEIANVAAGKRDDRSSVFPHGQNLNLLILVVVGASATASLIVGGLIFALASRRRHHHQQAAKKVSKLQLSDDVAERGKLQEDYKQLCRDWSKTTSNSQTANENKKPMSGPLSKLHSNESNGSNNSGGNGSNRSSTSSWTDEPANNSMDISTGHMVLAYMEDHLKNKQRLEQEWVGLCGYEAEPSSTAVAFKAENKKKNRYPDKLPYDHNRVILNALVNATNSDYINASTVTDHDPRNPSYIVTQGPLGQTAADFWQMVWEQGCVVIVMLSRLQDNGYQLCTRYWPEEGSEQYHIFEVHLVSEHVWCEDYLVRSVYLKNTRTGETRTVTQFHYRSWPAHGVPSSTKALLEFRRKVNKSYRGRSCPIVVHCSDGVGRSGTYVLIDMVLNRLSKGCKEIDIAATLEHIRDQRGGMVQNRQQFEFCLMAVAEEVHAILKALPQ